MSAIPAMAASTSCSVLKAPIENRTPPSRETVPSCACTKGAQCRPVRVAILWSPSSMPPISPGATPSRFIRMAGEVVFKAVAAVQLDASDLPETIHESLCQLPLARMDIRDAVLVQPVLSGPQLGYAAHVWRAVFKPPGILLEMERMDRPNAGAAAAHLFDAYVLANTKAADAHAPHERFVAGEGNHIDVHLPHVDRNDAGGLSGIHDEPDAALAADRPNLLDWLHRTDHVRSVVDDHKLRVRPYGLGDIVRVHEPGVVERAEGRLCAVVADHTPSVLKTQRT